MDELAEFDITRGTMIYGVTVKNRKGNDKIERLQITVTNKDDKNDSDYLIIRDTGLSPRTLEDFLAARIAVSTKTDEKAKKEVIDNIALAADPLTKKKIRSKSITANRKQKRVPKSKAKSNEEAQLTETHRGKKVSEFIMEERKI